MLDLGFVREHLPLIEEKLRLRGMDPGEFVGKFKELDERRRLAISRLELSRQAKKKISQQVGGLKQKEKKGLITAAEKQQLESQIKESSAFDGDIAQQETTLKGVESEFQPLLATIPNLPHASVPPGSSPADNQEIRRGGTPVKFDFTPKSHWELGEQLGVLDMERAAQLSGARFAVYWDMGAKLERALATFMLALHTREHGYTEVLPPYMVNSDSMYGTGQLPKFADDLFKCEKHDLWLVPTAEVPLTNLYREETLEAARLPLSLTAFTPCFRSEAGSYGKDVRGIIRQHQFQKVELVKFARPEDSYEQLEKLTRDAEVVLQRLGLHYRVVALCTADLGFAAAKTYDIEVWLPGQQLFREISSCSNFESFQARRANIRYRPEGAKKSAFGHTLNGSGLAIGRTWLAILENYQQADGSVMVPEALRPYMGAERITARKF